MPRPPYWWPPRFSRRIGLPIKVCGLPTCTAAKPTAHDNWYEYQYVRGGREIQSYWQNRVGIDVGEPSRAEYAFHLFAGHHGIFSLTPIWILSVIGVAIWLGQRDDRRLRELSLLIAAVTLVVVAFYIMRPQEDRNYGGMTTGLRWVFWLAPLWLVTMLPALDVVGDRTTALAIGLRWLALAALGWSAACAVYATWNPWTQPLLFDFFKYLHWI